ncbi:MAG: phage head closure protein [Psychrilyobacter sp.]|uniref:phage head closure protein n=1 Tax=Psychrilyobacter sp. TaxID=2586924 RepID=UPI003C712494
MILIAKNKKSLASRLNNRLEVWGNVKVKTDIGNSPKEKLIKKIWGKISPIYGFSSGGDAGTIKNTVNLKIMIRKTDISNANWIIYKGQRYDISHILPNYDSNEYLDLNVFLHGE